MRRSGIAPAIFALLSLTATVSACGSDHAGTAADASATSRMNTATTPATPPSSPAPTAPDTPPATSAAPDTASTALPGVVANCTSAPPYRLSTRPGTITLACADDGLGVQDMTWGTWAASAASGQGKLWEKLCVPNCAEGKTGTYPVAVTLSAVRSSASGPWFSRLTVTWEGQRPPGTTPSSFPLPKP
jgi:hypothetical protein